MKFLKEDPVLGAAIILFVISLVLPAVGLSAHPDYVWGYELLGWGWWGIFFGIPGWLANPLAIGAIFLAKSAKSVPAFMCSLAALALGLSSLFTFTWWTVDEGTHIPVHFFHIGFYAWIASLALLTVYCFQSNGRKRI